MKEIELIFSEQKKFFELGKSKNIDFRINELKKLKKIIQKNEEEILQALKKDLGKSNFEAYATEVGIIYDEINLHIKNIRKWAKREKRSSPIVHYPSKSYVYKEPYGVTLIIGPFNYPFQLVLAPLIGAISAGNTAIIKPYYPSKSYVYKEPYGVTLIIGPFNYPFQLVLAPLIGAISAGNTAIIKPSENTINTAKLLEKIINNNFDKGYIRVVDPLGGKEVVSYLLDLPFDYIFFTGSVRVGKIVMEKANNFDKGYIRVVDPLGGKEVVSYLLDLPFDYIFFTGSVRVGKIVMEKAAKNLTPVTLELGGKSPCIVDSDADINLAAKRIVWGKFLNAGQTCVAPDYLFIHKNIKDKFLKALVKEIKNQFGENIKKSPDYPRIVNTISLDRFSNYLKDGEIYFGGEIDKETLYMDQPF